MGSTLTVQDAISFVSPFVKQQRLNVNNFQPGLGIANVILGVMLGPPLTWRFNRGNFRIVISASGGTDYQVSQPTLGRIETQWLQDANGAVLELNGAVAIAKSGASRRPVLVAPQYDDNQGNITFRFDSVPDQPYTAFFDFQQKAGLITSWAQNFAPVPDEFAYCFYKGFLAFAGMLVNDARFPIWESEFLASVLSTQEGLDEQARNIFLGQFTEATKTIGRATASAQSGIASRGKQ